MAQNYLSWNKKTISDFSSENIDPLYNQGFVFIRIGRGMMEQTRSLRVDLSKFSLSSENRRILRKTDGLKLVATPLPDFEYSWIIGKLGKDFYDSKFGNKTFSANKIKELITDPKKSNFNCLLKYFLTMPGQENNPLFFEDAINFQNSFGKSIPPQLKPSPVGYCISLATQNILHYCYPFYNLNNSLKDMGLSMMTRAVVWAREQGKKYVYLGSFQRPSDVYKLQFEGLEWWDGEKWSGSTEDLKKIEF